MTDRTEVFGRSSEDEFIRLVSRYPIRVDESMSLLDLAALYDVAGSLVSVANGFLSQPRFVDKPVAAAAIDDFLVSLDDEMTGIAGLIAAKVPQDKFEREQRAHVLIRHAISVGDGMANIAALAAQLAAERTH